MNQEFEKLWLKGLNFQSKAMALSKSKPGSREYETRLLFLTEVDRVVIEILSDHEFFEMVKLEIETRKGGSWQVLQLVHGANRLKIPFPQLGEEIAKKVKEKMNTVSAPMIEIEHYGACNRDKSKVENSIGRLFVLRDPSSAPYEYFDGGRTHYGVFWDELPQAEKELEVLRYYASKGGVTLVMSPKWWDKALDDKKPFPGWPQIREAATIALIKGWAVVLDTGYIDTISQDGLNEARRRGLEVSERLQVREAEIGVLTALLKEVDPDVSITEGCRRGYATFVLQVKPSKRGLRMRFVENVMGAGFLETNLPNYRSQMTDEPFYVVPLRSKPDLHRNRSLSLPIGFSEAQLAFHKTDEEWLAAQKLQEEFCRKIPAGFELWQYLENGLPLEPVIERYSTIAKEMGVKLYLCTTGRWFLYSVNPKMQGRLNKDREMLVWCYELAPFHKIIAGQEKWVPAHTKIPSDLPLEIG